MRVSTLGVPSFWFFDINIGFSGESIPIRLFLNPYELTPTYHNINNKFSVKYFLNLVFVDEEERRYFKQQEIIVYRLFEDSWMNIMCLCLWNKELFARITCKWKVPYFNKRFY